MQEEKLATLAEKYAANEDHVVVTRRDSYLDPEFERKDAMDDYAVRKREAAIREERRLLRKENERVRRLSAWKERMEMARNMKESEHDRERRELAEAREEAEKERQLREQKANEEKRRKQVRRRQLNPYIHAQAGRMNGGVAVGFVSQRRLILW